jgi:hypothetical protein
MALAGVILGSIWLVLIAVVVAIAVATDSGSDGNSGAGLPGLFSSPGSSASPMPGAKESDAFDVSVGDCLSTPPTGEVKRVDVQPCSTPHTIEAYATFDLSGSSYPGDAKVSDQAESGCATRFAAFVGRAYDDSGLELYYLHPTSQSWRLVDDREVVCLVESPTPVTGTLRNSRR